MKKTTTLKNLLESNDLSFLMEAHNGLSAKIVEEAGFQAIWGSGLSISAAMGVRDNNEASWTQVLEVVEFMSDATTVPILLDGDTGYGNFNNMRRLVKKLEQRNIAGVCIEDKIFPKTNSFLRGEKQPLADIDEFSGKIKAGLDARLDEDFCIVARVEAFIAGHGLSEAMKRAEAYHKAGATAILMHSKKNNPEEIFGFMQEWGNRCPVVIVPTKYYATPTSDFKQHKISAVIWANHLLRSSIKSMQETASRLYTEQSLLNIEDKVASVKEIFRLQNDRELVEAEKRYFQSTSEGQAIILAASRGEQLGELTINKPKALLNVQGSPILKQVIDKIRAFGINEIAVVRGYKKETFPDWGCTYIDNDQYQTTGELFSLLLAQEKIKGNLIILYGDTVFKSYILSSLLETGLETGVDISIVVDSDIANRMDGYIGDFVVCSKKNSKRYDENSIRLLSSNLLKKSKISFDAHGEWIGLLKTTCVGAKIIKDALVELANNPNFKTLAMGDLLNHLVQKDIEIGVTYVEGHWMDIDNCNDFEKMQVF